MALYQGLKGGKVFTKLFHNPYKTLPILQIEFNKIGIVLLQQFNS